MQAHKAVHPLLMLLGVVGLPALVISGFASGWDDWVVFAIVLLWMFGTAHATYARQYTTTKRTFVRRYDEEESC